LRRRSRIDHRILDGFLTSETSFLMAEEVKALVGTMRITVEELIAQLLPWSSTRAIAPVSGFKVGAVGRGVSGNLYFGTNIEFVGQALHATIHAEQCCIANLMSKGDTGLRALNLTASPCGHCRQFLNETNSASEMKLYIPGQQALGLPTLLPEGFGPRDLNVEFSLLDPQDHRLQLQDAPGDELVEKALQASNQSYAPYSESYAGIAIRTRNGQIFHGIYAECAAYNPSLLPLQACIANLIMAGRSLNEISEAVLVNKKNSKVSHALTAQSLLKSLTDIPLKVYLAE
jgi:cytidine deaminase